MPRSSVNATLAGSWKLSKESKKVIKLSIDKISKLISNAELLFDKSFDQSKIDELNDLKKIINPKNISRKECLLLPFKTLSKALNL